jgi:hypothetical protein
MSAVRVRHRPPFFLFFISILLRWFGALARCLRAACPCAEARAAPSPCLRFARQTSPRGERGSTGAAAFSHLLFVTGSVTGFPRLYARERIAGRAAFPFSPTGRRCRQADEGAARRFASISEPPTHTSGHPALPLAKARQNATAVIFRTGSGGRLTSRCCHEDTWPFFFSEIFDSIRPAAPPSATAP